eukprot:693816-Pyramimonas_sp.AAC.1
MPVRLIVSDLLGVVSEVEFWREGAIEKMICASAAYHGVWRQLVSLKRAPPSFAWAPSHTT